MEFDATEEDLKQLREWLEKMPYLIQDYDDRYLSAFIRASKGSLQKAKMYLENYCGLGFKYPDFFGTFDPLHPPLQEHATAWLLFPLPKKTSDGCTVLFSCLNPKCDDPYKSHIDEYYRFILLTFYVLIWDNDFGSGKWKHVGDYRGCNLTHLREMTPTSVKQIIKIAESAVPVRLQAVVAFNLPTFLEHFFNFIKIFAKSKLAQRIFVYGSSEKITEHVPLEMLPKEYGGSENSMFVLHDNWNKKLVSYRQRFLEEERKLRALDIFRPRSEDEEGEMSGTFRQLRVD